MYHQAEKLEGCTFPMSSMKAYVEVTAPPQWEG